MDTIRVANSGSGYIQLPMGEAWPLEQDRHALKWLALGLVNGHCEGRHNRELHTLEEEG